MKHHRPSTAWWVPPLISLGMCLVVFGLFWGTRYAKWLEYFELKAYDLWVVAGSQDKPPDNILLLELDDVQIGGLGHSTLTDEQLTKVLQTIQKHKPRVIGVDLFRDLRHPPGDGELTAFLKAKENRNVVLIMRAPRGPAVPALPPHPALADAPVNGGRVGDGTIVDNDVDGLVRRGQVHLTDEAGRTVPSLGYVLALRYLTATEEGRKKYAPKNDPADPRRLMLGGSPIMPFDGCLGCYVNQHGEGYQVLLDYKSGVNFNTLPVTDLLPTADYPLGKVRPADIADKIVIIGKRSDIDKDYFQTPLHKDTTGMAIHAAVADQIIRGATRGDRGVRSPGDWLENLWILAWSLLGGLVGYVVRSTSRWAAALLGGLAVLTGISYAAFAAGWWVPLVPAAMTFFTSTALVTAYFASRERAMRAVMTELVSPFIDKDVFSKIWDNREELLQDGKLEPQDLTATVLFTDMKGFSTISKDMTARELMPWLNRYMNAMSRVVSEHHGVVNKYMGDAILAVFGVPTRRTTDQQIADDARNAVRCAVAMRRRLAQLNVDLRAEGVPEIGMRIGVFTGELSAGTLGGQTRLEYTVIGDIVNIAARLESHAKDTLTGSDYCAENCRILIGKPTYDLIDGQFKTKDLGPQQLKGIESEPVPVFGVVK